MKVHTEFDQYTPEWWTARCGKPSSSNADRIITPKTRKLSASADDYIAELIADSISHTPNFFTDRPRSRDMEHGTNCEPEARRWLAMDAGFEILEVGGCESDDGRFWCSPDGLVEQEEAVVELKCPSLKTHCAYLLDPEKLIDDYRPQCHWHLFVTGWKKVLLVSYVVEAAPLILTVVPDDFTRELKVAAELFYARYQKALQKVKGAT